MRRVAWSTAQRRVEDLLAVEWSVRSRGRGHQHLRRCVESCQFFAQLAGAGDAALANPSLAGCRPSTAGNALAGQMDDRVDPIEGPRSERPVRYR